MIVWGVTDFGPQFSLLPLLFKFCHDFMLNGSHPHAGTGIGLATFFKNKSSTVRKLVRTFRFLHQSTYTPTKTHVPSVLKRRHLTQNYKLDGKKIYVPDENADEKENKIHNLWEKKREEILLKQVPDITGTA